LDLSPEGLEKKKFCVADTIQIARWPPSSKRLPRSKLVGQTLRLAHAFVVRKELAP